MLLSGVQNSLVEPYNTRKRALNARMYISSLQYARLYWEDTSYTSEISTQIACNASCA